MIDEQLSASEHDYASNRSAIGAGDSLAWDPGRNATVLARSDLAVDDPSVHWVSRGVGHSLRSSTCIHIIGASGPFCMPTVWPVACRTTC